jgi:hypothetical protein
VAAIELIGSRDCDSTSFLVLVDVDISCALLQAGALTANYHHPAEGEPATLAIIALINFCSERANNSDYIPLHFDLKIRPAI